MGSKVLNHHSLSSGDNSVLILITLLSVIYLTEGRLPDLNAFTNKFPLALPRCSKFIAELVKSFNWSSVGILHDTESDPTVSTLHNFLRQKTPSTQIVDFNIDTTNVKEILEITHTIMVPSINIVLMCNSRNTRFFLEMANAYDSGSNRTTDFRHLSKWIVLIDKRSLQDSKHLALDLENVLFITIPLTSDKDTERVNGFILHGTGKAGRLVRVTSFDLNDVFPNMKYGYNNRQLLVSTIKTIIVAYVCVFTLPTIVLLYFLSMQYQMKGSLYHVSMDILEAMAYHLNFSFQIIEPPDKKWGINRNGTWTGIMKQLQEREVDLAAVALTISDDRAAVFDYLLPPYITTSLDVLYRKEDVEDYNWLLLLKPFQSMVLLVLATCIIGVLLLYWILELHQRHSGNTRTKAPVIWFVVGSFLKQASTHAFSHVSAKILTSFWWIFLIVISSMYTAKLVAFLSVNTSKPPPFTNLLELSQRHDYTIGFPMQGFPAAFVQNSKREDMAGIWKRITQRNMTDPRVFSLDFDYHINQMKSGKYAAIMPGFIAQSYMAKVCGLALLGDKFLYEQMTFGLPKSSPLKPDFERVMQILTDSGLTDKWILEMNGRSNRSQCISEKTARTVTLANVGGGIVAAAGCAGLALLTLAAECLYHYTRTQR